MTALRSALVDDICEITLPPTFDMPAAADLREALLEMVTPGTAVNIRSDAVEQITTPGIQMLMAAASYAASQKAPLTLIKPSDVVIDGFSDLGLFSQLMAWNIE